MLPFTDVMHFFANELARLRRCGFAGTLISTRALQGFFLGHMTPP